MCEWAVRLRAHKGALRRQHRASAMRIRLCFDERIEISSSARRSWYEVPPNLSLISDLIAAIVSHFDLDELLRVCFKLDGFAVPSTQPIAVLREGDLVIVKRKGKRDSAGASDSLPAKKRIERERASGSAQSAAMPQAVAMQPSAQPSTSAPASAPGRNAREARQLREAVSPRADREASKASSEANTPCTDEAHGPMVPAAPAAEAYCNLSPQAPLSAPAVIAAVPCPGAALGCGRGRGRGLVRTSGPTTAQPSAKRHRPTAWCNELAPAPPPPPGHVGPPAAADLVSTGSADVAGSMAAAPPHAVTMSLTPLGHTPLDPWAGCDDDDDEGDGDDDGDADESDGELSHGGMERAPSQRRWRAEAVDETAWPCPLFAPRRRSHGAASPAAPEGGEAPSAYDALPRLQTPPHGSSAGGCTVATGDVLAFKVVELDASWAPVMSAWREARVLGWSAEGHLRLQPAAGGHRMPATSDAGGGTDDSSSAPIECALDELIDVRFVRHAAGSAAGPTHLPPRRRCALPQRRPRHKRRRWLSRRGAPPLALRAQTRRGSKVPSMRRSSASATHMMCRQRRGGKSNTTFVTQTCSATASFASASLPIRAVGWRSR